MVKSGNRLPQIDGKIVLLGSMGVGKTSLVEKFMFNVFQNPPNTIGAAYAEKKVEVNNKQVKLQVWDTGGQERYRAMAALYYRDAKVAIVCYSMAHKKSLEGVQYWVRELQKMEPNCKIYLCGTKMDLLENNNKSTNKSHTTEIQPVVRRDIKEVTNEFGIGDEDLYQTSSKFGDGVQELFSEVASYISGQPIALESSSDNDKQTTTRLSSDQPTRKSKCKCS